jgi:hypothetical protein
MSMLHSNVAPATLGQQPADPARLLSVIGLWSAGRLTLDGHPADAYDWAIKARAESEATGRC